MRTWRKARRINENADVKHAVYSILEAHDLKVLNTFDHWYRFMDDALSDGDRWTWEGAVLGRRRQAPIYDAETFDMLAYAQAAPSPDLGFPPDRKAVSPQFKIREPRALHVRRYE